MTDSRRKGDYPPGTRWFQLEDGSAPVMTCHDHGGRSIVLSTKQWHGHILVNHPEMAELVNHIEWSVTRPDIVTRDRVNPQRQCYYLEDIPFRRMPLVVKTIVHFDESVTRQFSADGFVVTTFLTRRINPREVVIWP